MLKNLSLSFFFFCCIFSEVSGYFWEFEQSVVLDGVLRRAERTITKRENGKIEDKIERSIVLVTDKPLVLTHSISVEKQPIASGAITYPHIEVDLPEEFLPLIEKHVQCSGTFRKTFNPHDSVFTDSVKAKFSFTYSLTTRGSTRVFFDDISSIGDNVARGKHFSPNIGPT